MDDYYLMATLYAISFMLFAGLVVLFGDWRSTRDIREFEAEHNVKIL